MQTVASASIIELLLERLCSLNKCRQTLSLRYIRAIEPMGEETLFCGKSSLILKPKASLHSRPISLSNRYYPRWFHRKQRLEHQFGLIFYDPHIRESVAQLIQAAIAKQQLQEHQRRESRVLI